MDQKTSNGQGQGHSVSPLVPKAPTAAPNRSTTYKWYPRPWFSPSARSRVLPICNKEAQSARPDINRLTRRPFTTSGSVGSTVYRHGPFVPGRGNNEAETIQNWVNNLPQFQPPGLIGEFWGEEGEEAVNINSVFPAKKAKANSKGHYRRQNDKIANNDGRPHQDPCRIGNATSRVSGAGNGAHFWILAPSPEDNAVGRSFGPERQAWSGRKREGELSSVFPRENSVGLS
ncbi:uncharacterized protein LY79DRAFT_576311 [Colletotrichum navitas]|uniref:Uncharacterized protein n=1 Tax=Colletotrichum navitas TaxID=681940 RepID=A0AAD8VAH4_9PEZI|nr:uncharacterized protein LY79DRAFT_576311 [Colletotrichum navitas]KAK1597981.1 hypothetical protein LY79DRAFT_576311 [Colletotrichum navitas]